MNQRVRRTAHVAIVAVGALSLFVSLLSALVDQSMAGAATSNASTSFSYTGAAQTYTVPAGDHWVLAQADGAAGGSLAVSSDKAGGLGGAVTAVIPVTPGEVLTIYVGQQPATTASSFGGGGSGGAAPNGSSAGAGGGASAIYAGGTAATNLALIAGGGGGGALTGAGGAGGNPAQAGAGPIAGGGATQTGGGTAGSSAQGAGGAAGTAWSSTAASGGAGGSSPSQGSAGGGGGGGYYGGGGAGANTTGYGGSGGGGGSSWVESNATEVGYLTGHQAGNGAVTVQATSTPPWSAPAQQNGGHSISSVSCPSTTLCWVVGATGYADEWANGSWQAPVQIDGTRTIRGISCPSTTLCWAVGAAGYAIEWNGSSWAAPIPAGGAATLNSISCPSTTLCWAVGDTGDGTEWNGSGWLSQSSIDSGGSTVRVWDVSCPSVSLCLAVDTYGYAIEWTGSSWGSRTTVNKGTGEYTIACASTTMCWAAGWTGRGNEWNGSSWTGTTVIDSGGVPRGLSCPSTTECWAFDTYGRAVEWNGTAWGTPYSLNISATGWLGGSEISCASTTQCWVGANTGNVTEWVTSTSTVTVVNTTTAGTSVRAIANISPGSLGFTSALPSLAWSWIDNGHAAVHLPMVGTTESIGVADARGSGAGWAVDLTSTIFTTASPAHTLPATAATVQTPPAAYTCTATDFGGCAVGSNTASYPYTVPAGTTAPAATILASAATTTGMGDQMVHVPFDLTIPASAYAGTYHSTWTFSLISGP